MLAGAAMIGSVTAQANSLIPSSPTVQHVGANYRFFYDVDLSASSRITNDGNSYFAFYDIPGYIAGTATVISGDFTEVDEATTTAPLLTNPVDTALLNTRFTYTGPGVEGPATVLRLSFDSIYANTNSGSLVYAGQDRFKDDNSLEGNTGIRTAGPAVPSPA